MTGYGQQYRQLVTCMAMSMVMLAIGCTDLPSNPGPVVPTKSSLPYTAQLRLTDIAAYMVEPGATLRPDPNLQNTVTQAKSVPTLSAQAWDKSIVDYVTDRQTFRHIVPDGRADVIVMLRIFVFIDPGLGFRFRHTYLAQADAALKDPTTGSSIATYTGFGKAFGVLSRDTREDDEGPINKSVQRALNELLGKIESDKRILP